MFLSLPPQFVDPGDAAFIQTLVLSGTFLAMGLVWLLAYVAIVTRAASFLRQDRVRPKDRARQWRRAGRARAPDRRAGRVGTPRRAVPLGTHTSEALSMLSSFVVVFQFRMVMLR